MADSGWVIFDADNTLWDVEKLYNDARTAFCNYVLNELNRSGENRRQQVSFGLLEQVQRSRDIQLCKTHGYSTSRFARSFEDTLTFFMPFAPDTAHKHVRFLAQDVFEKPALAVNNLDLILTELSKSYALAIISAGERWVQEKRLSQFGFNDKFKDIQIVERKHSAIFHDFCKKWSVNPERCWVIGDSPRSDILPAKQAGLLAIHVQAANWDAEYDEVPNDVQSVSQLEDILNILL